MRRIFIDDRIKSIAAQYKTRLQNELKFFDGKQNHIINPLKRLKALKAKFDNGTVLEEVKDEATGTNKCIPLADSKKFSDYLQEIIKNYPQDILTITPCCIKGFNEDIRSKLVSKDRLNANLKIGKGKTKPFYEHVVDTMQYDMIRRWLLPEYIREVGVKACVYCNANFTVTGDHGHAFYDIDHWRPKSKYPWACISFFNLQPSCHTCNQLKNDDEDLNYMGLYESDPSMPLDVLHFGLDKSGLADFIINHQDSGLQVKLKAYDPADNPICKKHNDKLLINEIYSQHQDVIKETVWRKMITNDSWRQSVKEGLYSLDLTSADIDRLLLGGYVRHEDTHKRPLSRLVQDIIEMDLTDVEIDFRLKNSITPANIEVGDYFLLDDNTIVKVLSAHHDYFDCSDNDVHTIYELQPLEWIHMDWDTMDASLLNCTIHLCLDDNYGNRTPLHIVQNKIRKDYGIEIPLSIEKIKSSEYHYVG